LIKLKTVETSIIDIGRRTGIFSPQLPEPVKCSSLGNRRGDQELTGSAAVRHHDRKPIAATVQDAVRHVQGLAVPEHQLLQTKLQPLGNLNLISRATAAPRLPVRPCARLDAHPSLAVDVVEDDDWELQGHLARRAEPFLRLGDTGDGERVVVGWCARAGVCGSGSEEDGLAGLAGVTGGESV